MENKKRKLEESLESGAYDGTGQGTDLVHKYIAPFSATQVSELLADICNQIPEAFEILQQKADESLNHRKVFARGLAWNSKGQDLEDILSKHGRILETSVITDKTTGTVIVHCDVYVVGCVYKMLTPTALCRHEQGIRIRDF